MTKCVYSSAHDEDDRIVPEKSYVCVIVLQFYSLFKNSTCGEFLGIAMSNLQVYQPAFSAGGTPRTNSTVVHTNE